MAMLMIKEKEAQAQPMTDYKKDIIMIYHIPVDGLTRQKSEHQLYEFMQLYKTGDFYREYFFPKSDGIRKVDIEIINLKGQKTENIQLKFEQLEDTMQKYFEPKRWNRKSKLKRILKWKKKK